MHKTTLNQINIEINTKKVLLWTEKVNQHVQIVATVRMMPFKVNDIDT